MARRPATKICTRCREPKLLSEFHKSRADCIACEHKRNISPERRRVLRLDKIRLGQCHGHVPISEASHSPRPCFDDTTADRKGLPRCPCNGDPKRCRILFPADEEKVQPTSSKVRPVTYTFQPRGRRPLVKLDRLGRGNDRPAHRKNPIGNSGSPAEDFAAGAARRAFGWRLKYHERRPAAGLDAVVYKGSQRIGLCDIQTAGGTPELTSHEWERAQEAARRGLSYWIILIDLAQQGITRVRVDPLDWTTSGKMVPRAKLQSEWFYPDTPAGRRR